MRPRATIDDLCIHTVRTLSMDAVQRTRSGHPGTPMALAAVVSTPWQHFPRTARVAVEQASVIGWDRYVGRFGAKIGMHTFGSSAPLEDLLAKFGFTPDRVLAAAREQMAKGREQRA